MQPKRTTPAKTCEHCGQPYSKPPKHALAQYLRSRFCARRCTDEARRGVPLRPVAERFWEKVDRFAPESTEGRAVGPCWIWLAARESKGYGQFYADGALVVAHKWAYEAEHGSVPDGYELDHLCRVRLCVRPSHLEPVVHHVNVARGMSPTAVIARSDTCSKGHAADGDNLYYRGRRRICRLCTLASNLAYRARQQAAGH